MKAKVDRRLDALSSLVEELKKASGEIGAVAIFIGVVRGTDGGEKVLRLEYEVHETLAPKVLNRLIEEVKEKYGLIDVVAEHRVGAVPVGEDIMYVLVASKHRKEAFEALAELVERIKQEVPIWKREVTEKGARYV